MNTLYVGLDIAKHSLQVNLLKDNFSLLNNSTGHRQLIKRLQASDRPVQVICEASGGYEQALLSQLHQAQIPASVVDPSRVRSFAKARGLRAKTDRIDAQLLSEFGHQITPAARCPLDAATAQLRELTRYRAHLLELKQSTSQQKEHLTLPALRHAQAQLQRQFQAHLRKVEEQITALLRHHPKLNAKAQALQQVKGVGEKVTACLLAEMPELGTLNRAQAASLAGVAPFSRESGQWRGKRFIGGGRPLARKSLYMAALVASRHHPSLKTTYLNLIARGKAKKVALTALMRKLIILLNSQLKYLHIPLAP